ncbi:NAD(P)-binding domain-containing protein [Gaetbulibacter sp. M235]|uniref:NAD(P)-binding domain-containing protein n=1 Tax=Gaetbulibacter sp. M235 TaxID=3126510 RepID=UPI00374E4D31
MNQRISILGCGWLGMALALELIKKGHRINGSTTSQNRLSKLESNGIKPFVIDIGNKNIDISDFLFSDVLVIAIPSKNIEDFKNLISKIEKSEIRKIVFISSTSVYPDTNGIVTKETPTKNTHLSDIERLFKSNAFFKTTIIRFGGLFGYDRQPGNFIKPGNKLNNPKGYINLIHRDDCIRIIEQIIMKDIWNEILNACSDSHPMRMEFYLKEFKKLGRTDITFDEQSDNSYKIVSSQKLKDLLNYEFEYNNLMNY